MNVQLTSAQQKVSMECQEKLGEHFEAFVLIVLLKDDKHQEDCHLAYAGGGYQAMGLLRKASANLEGGKIAHQVELE